MRKTQNGSGILAVMRLDMTMIVLLVSTSVLQPVDVDSSNIPD